MIIYLTWAILACCVAGLILKFGIYRRLNASHERIEGLLRAAEDREARGAEREQRAIDLLQLIKEWAFSGAARYKDAAAHHEDAAVKLQQVVQAEAAQPTRAEILDAVNEVPARVAAVAVTVAEQLKAGDSGVLRRDGDSGETKGVKP